MARLALAGGTPVRTEPFTQWPDFDERERTLLLEALEARDWGGYPFPNTMADRFASAFAAAHDARHAFAVANGTLAIEIALKAAGLRSGDEVILPAYTFEASAAPVLRLEAVPVFADVLPTTWCLDPAATEAAITPRTRAILPVYLAMCMADMDASRLSLRSTTSWSSRTAPTPTGRSGRTRARARSGRPGLSACRRQSSSPRARAGS